MQPCIFCGGDPSEPDHARHCDGRQGRIEAETVDDADPLYGAMGDVPFEVMSDTSAAAADSIEPDTLARLEALVLDTIKAQPRTCDDIECLTGLSHQTASARIRGLFLRDLVTDSGARAPTRSGRNATIWRVKTAEDRQHDAA